MIRRWFLLINQYSLREKITFLYSAILFRLSKIIDKDFTESRNVFPLIMDKGFEMVRIGKENKVYSNHLTVHLRRNTSDISVFKQIIVDEEYCPIIKLFKDKNLSIGDMIDAGANIGLTTLYIKKHFPCARVIALEPNSENYEQLKINTDLNHCEGLELLQAGLWNVSKLLVGSNEFGDKRHWAFSLIDIGEKSDGNIKVFDIDNLKVNYHIKIIDFLKVDVEGAEVDIFLKNENLAFLNSINVLAIEVHKKDTIHLYVQVFLEFGFKWFISGELLIVYRSKFLI